MRFGSCWLSTEEVAEPASQRRRRPRHDGRVDRGGGRGRQTERKHDPDRTAVRHSHEAARNRLGRRQQERHTHLPSNGRTSPLAQRMSA